MNAPLRAAIVDDEPLARMRLARILGGIDAVAVVGSYGDAPGALAGLRAAPADVLFLDIRMPEVDGFELLRRMPAATRPLVVFVSAYGERALEAFDVEAVDYVLKPLSQERVLGAVARARAWHARRRVHGGAAAPGAAAAHGLQRIAVPDGPRLRLVEVDDIVQLLAQGNYVELVLPGRSLLLREPLSSLVARLDPARFVRVHRSRAVRIDMVEQVEPGRGGCYVLRLKDGSRLLSGRQYRDALRAALGISG